MIARIFCQPVLLDPRVFDGGRGNGECENVIDALAGMLRVERANLPTDEIPVVVEEQRPARSSIINRIPRTIRGLSQLYFVLKKIPPAASTKSTEAEAA